MNKYEIIKDLGGGSYGTVYEGINNETNEKVAIKKLKQKMDSWDDCMNQNEVYFLRKLNHPNIIKLIEVIREPNSDISFVFEFCECNLYEYITNHRKRKKAIQEDKIQNIIYNIARGLSYMHSENIMHRDLKPENILISLNDINIKNNIIKIKIADFGAAKEIPQYKDESLTDYICTRWYRAPECVLKSKHYDEKIDVWALGCIMAELYNLRPLFPGQSEFDQIDKIVRILGTPSYEEWPEGYRLMENLNMKFPQYNKKNFKSLFFDISDEAIDFMEYIFQYDSAKRPSANDLLKHPYLNNNLNTNKMEINSFRSQSRKEHLYPLKDNNINNIYKNVSINSQIPYNYQNILNEDNNYNNKANSPIFMLPQIKNKSINLSNSRFNDEDIFYNKKPGGRSKSSIIEKMKNSNNINENNTYNVYNTNIIKNNNHEFSKFSNYENESKELSNINNILENNIKNMNNYDNIYNYNKRNKKSYIPFKNDNKSTINNAFSSVAKNEIVQNKPFLYNRYIEKQKETINNADIFHNVIPKIRQYSNNNNNYNMFNYNKNLGYNNNQENNYRSFFATRYNL